MSDFALPSGRSKGPPEFTLVDSGDPVLAIACFLFFAVSVFGQPPAVGAKAPDFTLSTPTGKAVTLSTEEGGAVPLLCKAGS